MVSNSVGRLQDPTEYLVGPNAENFTIEISNPNLQVAIVGVRVLLGTGEYVKPPLHQEKKKGYLCYICNNAGFFICVGLATCLLS